MDKNPGNDSTMFGFVAQHIIDALPGNCPVFVPDATLPIPSMQSSCIALGNCSCITLPPVTHMDVGNAKAMLEHRWPSMQSYLPPSMAVTASAYPARRVEKPFDSRMNCYSPLFFNTIFPIYEPVVI